MVKLDSRRQQAQNRGQFDGTAILRHPQSAQNEASYQGQSAHFAPGADISQQRRSAGMLPA
jgi:hypothetical protein